jgi:A/G-specific adenine glycosylase
LKKQIAAKERKRHKSFLFEFTPGISSFSPVRKAKTKQSDEIVEQRRVAETQHSISSALLNWFCANARDLPWRRTRDPYAIWVSEIMLQQTQVKTVIPYWERWMRELPDIQALATATPEKIHKLWEGLGYYTRVRNMQKAAQTIVEKFNGTFPSTFDDILALPGIGRYTAGAICSIAFNQPTPILDGNVIRVLTRLFGISENPRDKKTNEQLWKIAADLVSLAKAQSTQRNKNPTLAALASSREISFSKNSNFASSREIPACSFLNQSLMEHGALVCTPRQPRCDTCPIQKSCAAFRENRVEELPNLGKRIAATNRQFVAFIVEKNGKFLVQQRPTGVVNAHLWEFPNMEILPGRRPEKNRQFSMLSKQPFCSIKHTITRYRISLEVFRAELSEKKNPPGAWHSLAELQSFAFPSAHRKVLSALLSQSRD